jgi:hypothetical protein
MACVFIFKVICSWLFKIIMVRGIHHWNYLGFNIFFIDIHIYLLMDMFSFKAKTSSSINGIVL